MSRYVAAQSSFDTACLHPGASTADGLPVVLPIVQSTSYVRRGLESVSEHAYSRVSNPTVSGLEAALGALEDAPPAVCFSTGLAAETALFLALLKQGDHVVCGKAVYGGTTRLLEQILKPLGVAVTFADTTSLPAVDSAITSRTKLVFIETPSNPTLTVVDIAGIAALTKKKNTLLAVDNTFLTAVAQQPLDHGADISVYSTTKFIDGHSAALGGAIVTRDQAVIDRLRFIRKCVGSIQTPHNAWLTLQGLKTLPLRFRRQAETGATIAGWLKNHPQVSRVYYPGEANETERRIAARQHINGQNGAVVSFELDGGAAAARTFLRHLDLCTLCEHVGSVETLLTHPASMTHADVAPAQRLELGITDGLVRLSVGLEAPDDIIADLSQAIESSVSESSAANNGEDLPCPVLA